LQWYSTVLGFQIACSAYAISNAQTIIFFKLIFIRFYKINSHNCFNNRVLLTQWYKFQMTNIEIINMHEKPFIRRILCLDYRKTTDLIIFYFLTLKYFFHMDCTYFVISNMWFYPTIYSRISCNNVSNSWWLILY